MTLYPVSNIPNANDLLSQSQSQIQTNFTNINGWSAVDHIQYGASNNGQHLQVSFPDNAALATPSGLAAQVCTRPGTADTSKSQLFYTNSAATYQLNPIKAWAVFNGTNGALLNGTNISFSRTGAGNYLATVAANVLFNTSYGIIVTCSSGTSTQLNCDYDFSTFPTFIIRTFSWPYTQTDANSVSVIVLQI